MIFLYKVTSPNNKIYIGITSDFEHRVSQHIKDSKNINISAYNNKFKAAIRKYTPENMLWEIIDYAKNYETAHELERRYILHFDSYRSGYNMTLGGDGCTKDFIPYKWTREKVLLEAAKYNSRPEWNKLGRDSYLAAKRLEAIYPGLFNECLFKMSTIKRRFKPSNFKWSKEAVLEEAKKHENLKAFKSASTAYAAMHTYKKEDIEFYKLCTAHMKPLRGNYGIIDTEVLI